MLGTLFFSSRIQVEIRTITTIKMLSLEDIIMTANAFSKVSTVENTPIDLWRAMIARTTLLLTTASLVNLSAVASAFSKLELDSDVHGSSVFEAREEQRLLFELLAKLLLECNSKSNRFEYDSIKIKLMSIRQLANIAHSFVRINQMNEALLTAIAEEIPNKCKLADTQHLCLLISALSKFQNDECKSALICLMKEIQVHITTMSLYQLMMIASLKRELFKRSVLKEIWKRFRVESQTFLLKDLESMCSLFLKMQIEDEEIINNVEKRALPMMNEMNSLTIYHLLKWLLSVDTVKDQVWDSASKRLIEIRNFNSKEIGLLMNCLSNGLVNKYNEWIYLAMNHLTAAYLSQFKDKTGEFCAADLAHIAMISNSWARASVVNDKQVTKNYVFTLRTLAATVCKKKEHLSVHNIAILANAYSKALLHQTDDLFDEVVQELYSRFTCLRDSGENISTSYILIMMNAFAKVFPPKPMGGDGSLELLMTNSLTQIFNTPDLQSHQYLILWTTLARIGFCYHQLKKSLHVAKLTDCETEDTTIHTCIVDKKIDDICVVNKKIEDICLVKKMLSQMAKKVSFMDIRIEDAVIILKTLCRLDIWFLPFATACAFEILKSIDNLSVVTLIDVFFGFSFFLSQHITSSSEKSISFQISQVQLAMSMASSRLGKVLCEQANSDSSWADRLTADSLQLLLRSFQIQVVILKDTPNNLLGGHSSIVYNLLEFADQVVVWLADFLSYLVFKLNNQFSYILYKMPSFSLCNIIAAKY
eukprot:GHVL01044379.1.p1 GENE.GHVL01044379.1~~GHVL01044379.1.p1  ORF type:complete len:761 (-),score=91.09 GHVL01044379.1:2204-4486(-)